MNDYQSYRKKTYRDLLAILIVALIVFIIAASLDIFEIFSEFSQEHDDWELDEIAIALIISSFGFAFFSWQRWQELRRELTYRHQVEQELKLAKEKAEIANQAKSAFLANMSHELRTPLNGVLGYTQILMRDKTLTSKQLEGIGIIHRSGEYLLTLINDVLDLSKIEANRVELYPVNFNFDEFIRGIAELFEMRAQQKGITFFYKPISHLPSSIHADEKRLRQVLINILGNAIKFTQEGSVTLKIGYHEGKIRFQVEDMGVGIAPADIEKIFYPFQQVGDIKYRAEGTGLGLSITKKLVEMMGGELHVESQLDQGSIFWTALDLPDVSDLIKTQKTEEPRIIGFKGAPRKILVIDDTETNRSVMRNLLEPLGFEIVEAENGQAGLAMAKVTHFDLVLTDLVMPVMDGFEFTRQFREIPEFQKIPVIAASASVFDCYQERSKFVGCDDFMAKPFRTEVLFALLQKYLDLTFVYEEAQEFTAVMEKTVELTEEVIAIPSPQQAAILYDLAMMGDIGGILIKLDELEAEDSQLKLFIGKVRQLAKEFKEEQICEVVKQFLP